MLNVKKNLHVDNIETIKYTTKNYIMNRKKNCYLTTTKFNFYIIYYLIIFEIIANLL